jgi:glycosyltransferase involved in cell wall biosynthesis
MPRPDDRPIPPPHFRLPVPARPALSIVVPVFEEQAVIPVLVDRLKAVLDTLGVSAEVILVDDGSADNTLAEVIKAHDADPRFKGLSLSRNFGHQIAISAGLAEATGDSVIVMDGDLQDPPEAIPTLWNERQKGFDVVYVIRASRPEGWIKRSAYAAFYRLLDRLVAIPIPLDSGDFGLMSRRVVDLIVAMPERRRYVRGLRAWVGFRQVGVPIDRGARYAGRPKFTIGKLIGLAIDGLIGFGEGPLRPVGAIGLAAIAASGLGLLTAVARGVVGLRFAAGWVWVALGMLFFGGVQLLSMAIVGEYVGRILHEVNGRPLYVAGQRIGLGPAPSRHVHPTQAWSNLDDSLRHA